MATYSIASLSWIDPKTGLPEVDKKGDPGPTLVKNDVTGGACTGSRICWRSSSISVAARSRIRDLPGKAECIADRRTWASTARQSA